MRTSQIWQYLTQYAIALRSLGISSQQSISAPLSPGFAFSETWSVLGPFQIGTREAAWSADPLEYFGGFHTLEYDSNSTFRSSLGFNGTVSWSNSTAQLSGPSNFNAIARLSVGYSDIDWSFLQQIYGFAAVQWQGWARGNIYVSGETEKTIILYVDGILEYWIDDTHHFGGDFYGYGRGPLTLHLGPGTHQIDVRLVRDVRSMGGFIETPTIDVVLELQTSPGRPRSLFDSKKLIMADIIGGDFGPLASPYASTYIRNDATRAICIDTIEGMGDKCEFELLSKEAVKIMPGQTRPVDFQFACIPSYNRRMYFDFKYRVDGINDVQTMSVSTWPRVLPNMEEPHRITFLHPSGVVSWAILRAPSQKADCGSTNTSLPVLISLHGAGTSANTPEVNHAFDQLPDLCAWVLFPEGGSSWSGDDWHTWGFADVEAAVSAIPDWIEQVEWTGPGVNINQWLVQGHSNGGQGVFYALTHRPDKIIGAAALSHYSSIQNYVPYTFWRTADPGKTAVVQATLNSYRHDLLLDNAKDIPLVLQHGGLDRNAPAYHSRLINERIKEADGVSEYFEIVDMPHYWDGVMTTEHLRDFYKNTLKASHDSADRSSSTLRDFRFMVANPGDMGTKFGVKVLQLDVPGRLGRLEFTIDRSTDHCHVRISNIRTFHLPSAFDGCKVLSIDGEDVYSVHNDNDHESTKVNDGWKRSTDLSTYQSHLPQRYGRQLGAMDAIKRSQGAFAIVRHSNKAEFTALQISRNLFQYFSADSEITDDYERAITSKGNVISIAIGSDVPKTTGNHPIEIKNKQIHVRDGGASRVYPLIADFGLAAIFLRPLPDERLELVVWGADEDSLAIAARLVPMMTGTGQPDFVVVDRRMLWKGLDGALALGFFDGDWNVSRNSFLS